MKRRLWSANFLLLGLVLVSSVTAQPNTARHVTNDPARTRSIDLTGPALLDQIKCQHAPQVARAINAMLENRLIRYVDNESGIYLFAPIEPLKFLGLRVTYISGFDVGASFKGVPVSKMVGTAPHTFLEIDVAAPAAELHRRALNAGLVGAILHEHKRGFEVSAESSYLAPKGLTETSRIQCVNYWTQ